MNHFPLIRSCTLVASLTLLGAGSAWSASDVPTKASASQSKSLKSAQTSKKKSVKKTSKRQNTSLKLARADNLKIMPVAASSVTVNPYFVNQPAAILPKSVAPYVAQAASPAVAAVVAPAVTVAAVAVSQPAPAVAIAAPAAPVVVAAPAAPAVVAAPAAQPVMAAQPAPAVVKPVSTPVAAYQPWASAAAYRNPYLAYQQQPMMVAAAAPVYSPAPVSLPDTGKLFNSFNDSVKSLLPFQSAPSAPATAAKPSAPSTSIVSDASSSVGSLFTSLKMMLPLTGDSNILPTIKKVYPTGEKPLVVINFKCPTEVIGITPPPMKLLHEALNFGFDGLNKTNLLSFNLQQVCS